MVEQLTKEDCSNLQKLGLSYELLSTEDGYRWRCVGLVSACFPTSIKALKSLANYAALGELKV
jgi:hypothetical protein